MSQQEKYRDQQFVSNLILSLHSREQDFEEGDLLHRVTKFLHYEKALFPLAEINLDEFSIDEDLVQEYIETFKETGTCPEVVYDAVDKSMIDGLHRATALFRCGETHISALVGTEKLLNPYYDPNCNEDGYDDYEEDLDDSYTP